MFNETITLTLTTEQARTLLFVTRKIGGDPRKSRRKHMDQIRKELIHMLYPSDTCTQDQEGEEANMVFFPDHLQQKGSIYFRNERGIDDVQLA